MPSPVTTAAIFSPSVARQTASATRDWNYVNAWLASKPGGGVRGLLPIERNTQTLHQLFALASLNEDADEERDAVVQLAGKIADAAADQSTPAGSVTDWWDGILDAIESQLPSDGKTALRVLAEVASETTPPGSLECDAVVSSIVSCQLSSQAGEQALARTQHLTEHLDAEMAHAKNQFDLLSGPLYRTSPNMAKDNFELQRKTRAAVVRLDLLSEHGGARERVQTPDLPISAVLSKEQAYQTRKARLDELESELAPFSRLPFDLGSARQELNDLADELRALVQQRDALFDASGRKPGSSR